MSVSYSPITTSEQYEELCYLLQGKSRDFESEEKTKNPKVVKCSIIIYEMDKDKLFAQTHESF